MSVTRIVRFYRNTRIDASKLQFIKDIMNSDWLQWGHHRWTYELHFTSEILRVSKSEDIPRIVADHGQTTTYFCFFESRTGRRLEFDTTSPFRIRLEVRDHSIDPSRLASAVETKLQLIRQPCRIGSIFIAHAANPQAQAYATALKQFLELLEITVFTGQEFQLENNIWNRADAAVLLVGSGSDETWLARQLSSADTHKLTYGLISDAEANFDCMRSRERYTFSGNHISEAFVPLMTWLRQLQHALPTETNPQSDAQ